MRDRTCGRGGCGAKAHAAGLCWRHLVEQRRSDGDVCSVDGCREGRFYRGMCGPHASAASRLEHGRKDPLFRVVCEWCGRDAEVRKRKARFCSQECAKAAQAAKYRDRRLPVLHPDPDPLTWLPAKHPARRPAKRREDWWQLLVYGPCQHCGEPFMAVAATYETRSVYCSDRCQRAAARALRRARERGAFVERVVRRKIFERDGWRCQICRRLVFRSKVVPHPRAPTIDHIVPLAAGGSHEPANAQTACFECNSRKSDGAANDQLRLIG